MVCDGAIPASADPCEPFLKRHHADADNRTELPGGRPAYDTPVMKAQRYTPEEIFQGSCFSSLPHFMHEGRFVR